jgi:hypothetical protein
MASLLDLLTTNPLGYLNDAARATTGDLFFPLERVAKSQQQKDAETAARMKALGKRRLEEPEPQLRIGNKVY